MAVNLSPCCGSSRKRHGDLLWPNAVLCIDPVPAMCCSQVVSLETFAACSWTSPTWKAPFPALCEDLKEFIKFSVLILQSHCILESVAATAFSIMQLIYICKSFYPSFWVINWSYISYVIYSMCSSGGVLENAYWTVPCTLLQLRQIYTAQRPQKCSLHYNASYLTRVRYVVCIGKSSKHMLKIRSV